MKPTILYLLPLSALLTGLTACMTVDERERPIPDRAPHYEPRPIYGDYDYYFYPNVAVYFQVSTGFYYYEDQGRWVRVRQLPPHIRLDARFRRHLIIRDAHPYQWYSEHAWLYGGRDDDRDRRDDRRPERDIRPARPDGDRHERVPEREIRDDKAFKRDRDKEERREPPPVENRGQERKGQGVPGSAREDDPRGPKTQAAPRDDDKRPVYGRDRFKDGRPDKAHDSEERHEPRDTGPSGRTEGSPRRDAGKPGDKGSKDHTPGSKDDDDEDRDRERRGPGAR